MRKKDFGTYPKRLQRKLKNYHYLRFMFDQKSPLVLSRKEVSLSFQADLFRYYVKQIIFQKPIPDFQNLEYIGFFKTKKDAYRGGTAFFLDTQMVDEDADEPFSRNMLEVVEGRKVFYRNGEAEVFTSYDWEALKNLEYDLDKAKKSTTLYTNATDIIANVKNYTLLSNDPKMINMTKLNQKEYWLKPLRFQGKRKKKSRRYV